MFNKDKSYDIMHHNANKFVVDKHLRKTDTKASDDPLGTNNRMLYFEDKEIDNREHSEKVKDKFAEAQNDTRNANQFVRLVNAHLQDRVSQLEKIKANQNRFWDEVNMFKEEPKQNTTTPKLQMNSEVEEVIIIRDLSSMINKYGIEKLIKALDKIKNS